MEYGDAISAAAAEKAFAIAREQLTRGCADLRVIAAQAVAKAYCVCVVDGEDAAERRLSAIHARLIEQIEIRLTKWLNEQEAC